MTTPPKRIIKFEVPGGIVPFARAGGGKTMHRFTPKKQRNYMADIRTICAAAMQGQPPITGPVRLEVIAEYQYPQSWSVKKRFASRGFKTSKPDLGNIEKLVEDAINKIAYVDDAQIATRLSAKMYNNRFHLTVTVLEL